MSDSGSSSSSSSSSSDDDSSSGVLDLGASGWNRHKQMRPLRGRTLMQRLSLTEKNDDGEQDIGDASNSLSSKQRVPIHLLQKQIYPTARAERQQSTPDDTADDKPIKTELEVAVLQDCLSHHFLFAEHRHDNDDSDDQQVLMDAFDKVKFRKNEIIMRKGTPTDYLYILYSGDVKAVSENNSGNGDGSSDLFPYFGSKYTLLGELELLTHTTYESTVKATSQPCVFFRLAAKDFYRFRQQPPQESQEQRLRLLQQALPAELVSYFQDDDDDHHSSTILKRLVSNMKRQSFQKGDVLVQKRTRLDALVIIAEGTVVATNNTAGGRAYEDLVIGPGHARTSFGWQSVMHVSSSEHEESSHGKNVMTGTIMAQADGYALVISKKAFENAFHSHHSIDGSSLLSVHDLAKMRWKRKQLEQITLFKDSRLTSSQMHELIDLMHHFEYRKDEIIFKVGQKVEAAMYFVREGSVRLESNKGQDVNVIEAGGYFGEKNMLLDQNKEGEKHHEKRSLIKAISTSPSTKIDVLYLEESRRVVNTTTLGLEASTVVGSIEHVFETTSLHRHAMLGTGAFGQVWLASVPATDGQGKDVFALKVQPKYQLLLNESAERLISERNILASLHSPFISRLYFACQDDRRLFVVTELLRGGELESLLPADGMPENAAKFYAAGILEGLTHMHRKHIIHRDVKSENVLLNEKGYPVLIDFGFAKYVPDKTYTFCGSPMLTAPEIIRYKGHDKGVDHWSWAVTIYHIVTGKFPFYQEGMGELALYKRICKGTFELSGLMSVEFRLLMVALLYPDPSQRLGSRADGWRDIFAAPWFANDPGLGLSKLRKQTLQAPWVPEVRGVLDDSRFHIDPSIDDLMDDESCPPITDSQQNIYRSFGPTVESIGTRVYS